MREDILKAKELVIEAGIKLLNDGLVSRTWGNVSMRVDENLMVVTPKGRKYEDLTIDDIVVVDINTLKYEGDIKPSSETPMHAKIYKDRKEINACIHTHQMNASTCAAARREVPAVLDDFAQIVGTSVRVAAYSLPGSKKIVKEVSKAIKGRFACLLANHGAVCVGRNIDEAFVVAQILEKNCKAYIEASFIGGAKSINKFESYLMHQFYLRKYSKESEKNT